MSKLSQNKSESNLNGNYIIHPWKKYKFYRKSHRPNDFKHAYKVGLVTHVLQYKNKAEKTFFSDARCTDSRSGPGVSVVVYTRGCINLLYFRILTDLNTLKKIINSNIMIL